MTKSASEIVSEWIRSLPRGGQAQLAAAVGVTAPSVSRWSNGGAVDPAHYAAIEKFFGAAPGTLSQAPGGAQSFHDRLDLIQRAIDRAQAELDETRQALGLLDQVRRQSNPDEP